MKLLELDRHATQNNLDDLANGPELHDANVVNEFGQTLAFIGDRLNEEALEKYNKYMGLAVFGIIVTFAALMAVRNVAWYGRIRGAICYWKIVLSLGRTRL